MQSYFLMSKYIRLNSAHYFIKKIPNKQEIQRIAFNHSSNIDFEDFINLCKKFTDRTYFLLVIYTTLASNNS